MSRASTLRVNIVGDADRLNRELESTEQRLQNFGGSVSRAGGTLTRWVTGPIAGAVGALGGLAMKTANAADKIGKAADAAGLGVENFQELRIAFGEAGIEGDQVDGMLQRFNRRIGEAADESGAAAGAVEDLGLSLENADGSMRDTDEILDDVLAQLADVDDDARRAALAGDFFGNRMGPQVAAALSDGVEGMEEAREAARESGAVMSEEAVRGAEDFNDEVSRLQDRFRGLVQNVGQQVLPMLTDHLIPFVEDRVVPALERFAERVQDIVQWFFDLSPRTQAIIGGMVGLAAALGPVLMVTGRLISLVGSLLPLIRGLGAALTFLAANPVGMIITAVGLLVAGLVTAYQRSETFRDVVHSVFDAVAGVVEWAWENVIQPIWEAVGDWITGSLIPWFQDLREDVELAWQLIQVAVRLAWEQVIKPAWEAIEGFITGTLVPIFETIRDVATAVWEDLSGAIRTVWDRVIRPTWDAIKAFIDNVLAPAFRFARDVATAVWADIRSAVETAWDNVIRPVWDAIRRFIDDPLVPAFNTVRDTAQAVWEAVSGAVETAWDTARPVLETLRDFIVDTLTPVWDGLKEAAETAWEGVTSAVGGALRTLGGMVSSFLSVGASVADFIGMSNLAGVLQSGADSAAGWGEGFNRGGWVPGSGPDRDSVPAWLTPGEFVLNRRAAQRIPDHVLAKLNDPTWRLDRPGLGATGGDGSDLVQALNEGGYAKPPDEVLDWARRNAGAYQWGGFGPRYDCSGWISALSNYAATGNPRAGGRWATGQAGRQRLGRFVRGDDDPDTGFVIGVNTASMTPRGRPGHVAGTIAGVNVESSSARGSHVGGRRGWDYGQLRYHLPDYGGPSETEQSWWRQIGDAVAGLRESMDNPAAEMFRNAALSPVESAAEWLLDRVPFGSQLSRIAGLADGGATTSSGIVQVGEAGPEIVELPRGARVSPRDDLTDLVAEQNELIRRLREDLRRRDGVTIHTHGDDPRAIAQRVRQQVVSL